MGLDIVAYSNLKHLGHHEWLPDEEHDAHIEAYSYDTFAAHALAGVPDVRGSGLVSAGCFEVTNDTQTLRFRAGSYSGYGLWRADLAGRFNPYVDGVPHPGRPFYELVWFADSEGTLCTEAARALLADFTEHEQAYAGQLANDYNGPYFIDIYRNFKAACELAADNGLIEFC